MKKEVLFIWSVNNELCTKNDYPSSNYRVVNVGEIISFVKKNSKIDNLGINFLDTSNCSGNDLIKNILKKQYQAIIFFVNMENVETVINSNNLVKRITPATKTIAYGELVAILPDFFTNKNFDMITNKGSDQEYAITQYLDYLGGKTKIECLKNMTLFTKDENNVIAKEVFPNQDLGNHWELIDVKDEDISLICNTSESQKICLSIMRGCAFNCPYCNAISQYGTKIRKKSVKEIEGFIRNNHFKKYKFYAPNFTVDRQYAIELCTEIKKYKIKWSCSTRIDLLDEELIQAMAAAGCYKIGIGVESINTQDLKEISKKFTDIKETVKKVASMLFSNHIKFKALIMLGVPGQTKASILETLDFLFSLPGIEVRPTAYSPLQELRPEMSASEIKLYDKRTFYNDSVPGLSYRDFLSLIYDTPSYKNILLK